MARYFISFDRSGADEIEREFATLEDARNAAVAMLGHYLQTHPEFAYNKHWRVDLKDQSHRLLLHVTVATVDAPPPLNFRSFEG